MSAPCARSLWTSRAFSMLRRAASFCFSSDMVRTSNDELAHHLVLLVPETFDPERTRDSA